MIRATRALTVTAVALAGLTLTPSYSGAQTSAEAISAITTAEFQRRLEVCLGSEDWLREACLEALQSVDLDTPSTNIPSTDTAVAEPALDGAVDELHLVGIYEPRDVRVEGQPVRRGEVAVAVDRPGQSVALVLQSYDPVQWAITASADTHVARIIIGGHGSARSDVSLNGQQAMFERAVLPVAFEMEGPSFQSFHEAAYTLVEMSNADSFHGAYTAPAAGFTIARAPGISTRAEAQTALLQSARDRATLSPALQNVLSGVAPIAAADWRFTTDGFVGVNTDRVAVSYDIPLEVPDISWPMGVAHDPEGQMLWGVTLGGEGYLYEYDIARDSWLVWSMNRYDAGGLIFDAASNRLIATPDAHGGRGYMVIDRRANVVASVNVPLSAYPGLRNTFDAGNGPAPSLVPLAIDGTQLLVRPSFRRIGAPSGDAALTYLVDLSDGSVELIR
ncbi:hypothetical protein Jann_3490 [Jannaschia sp. CCS1]|nr:hypothetical protein Jann_3490 [Jannaschia sp. CCS1]